MREILRGFAFAYVEGTHLERSGMGDTGGADHVSPDDVVVNVGPCDRIHGPDGAFVLAFHTLLIKGEFPYRETLIVSQRESAGILADAAALSSLRRPDGHRDFLTLDSTWSRR